MREIPSTVDAKQRPLYLAVDQGRAIVKQAADAVGELRGQAAKAMAGNGSHGEVAANIALAFRHLEDASMRLGKTLQHIDQGATVRDRNTIGAPASA